MQDDAFVDIQTALDIFLSSVNPAQDRVGIISYGTDARVDQSLSTAPDFAVHKQVINSLTAG